MYDPDGQQTEVAVAAAGGLAGVAIVGAGVLIAAGVYYGYKYLEKRQTEDELLREEQFRVESEKTKEQRVKDGLKRDRDVRDSHIGGAPDAVDGLESMEHAQTKRRPHVEKLGKATQKAKTQMRKTKPPC